MILNTSNFSLKKSTPLEASKFGAPLGIAIFNLSKEFYFLVWAKQSDFEKGLINSPKEYKYLIKVSNFVNMSIKIIDLSTKKEISKDHEDAKELLKELELHGYKQGNELTHDQLKALTDICRPGPLSDPNKS